MARVSEGVTRNAGKHAGGVGPSRRPLPTLRRCTAMKRGKHPVTQFDKSDVEYAGLVVRLPLGFAYADHHQLGAGD